MIYCDTSLIVTALTAEPSTRQAQRWLSEREASGLCASLWVETEVASALGVKLRAGALNAGQRAAAFAQWRALIAAWEILPIEPDHFTNAAELTNRGLRAGDALHLAIAVARGAELATRDHDLARVSEEIGLVTHRLA